MYIFDAHIDTLGILAEQNGGEDLATLTGTHVNLAKMRRAGISAQIFAIYVPDRYRHGLALHKALKMVDIFWENLRNYPQELQPLLWRSDCQIIEGNDMPIRCMLSLEGGEALEGSIANLRNFFRLGVRALTITWNHRNELADGVGEGKGASGLSEFGREVVAEMNRLGMVIDVSHLAEPGFWDVLDESNQPIIASHSNAYTLCQHRRNLTDAQIKAIADCGGVVGVNFYPGFLTKQPEMADIEHVVEQIVHLIDVGGSETAALGSDFDGIGAVPVGLENVEKTPLLISKLKKRGLSEAVVEKVMGKNLLRVVRQVLPEKSS